MAKEYNKDYTTKTADEWFSLKKWTGFLMTIPVGRTITKTCDNVREVLSIRATAAIIAGRREAERSFSVTTDIGNERVIYVTATKKINV